MRFPPVLALLFVAASPSAVADASGSSQFSAELLAFDAPTTMPLTVSFGCDLVLTTGGGTATLTMDTLPTWLSAPPVSLEVDPLGCVPGAQGNITQQTAMTVTPKQDAPGLVPTYLNVTLSYKGKMQGEDTATIPVGPASVAYRPGHKITPDGDQTFTVPAAQPYSFDMTIEVTANARTMVMFEDKTLSDPAALVNGLKAHTYNVPAGETKESRKVVFTPPEGAWESVAVKFRTFSHCLDGADCDEQDVRTVTWTFNSEAPTSTPVAHETNPANGAPAPAALWIVLTIALAALVKRRR